MAGGRESNRGAVESMSLRLIVRPEAEQDIAPAAVWYEEKDNGLGFEFLAEIRNAINRSLQNPELFARLRREPEVRRILARRFPYRFFFINRKDAVVVFAVLHVARHDRLWRRRV